MGKLLIYCYSITFFDIIVIFSAIKKIVIATWSAYDTDKRAIYHCAYVRA